jgi:hypothetical protein
MKTKPILLTLALCFVGSAIGFAASPLMGTWKLNEGKSKLAKSIGKNSTVVYESAGRSVKIVVDGVDAKGKPTHSEWTGKFDGKDYPVKGDSSIDARSYRKISERILDMTNKKEGKVTMTGQVVVSDDGKSRTVTVTGMDPDGKKFNSKAVYDKE